MAAIYLICQRRWVKDQVAARRYMLACLCFAQVRLCVQEGKQKQAKKIKSTTKARFCFSCTLPAQTDMQIKPQQTHKGKCLQPSWKRAIVVRRPWKVSQHLWIAILLLHLNNNNGTRKLCFRKQLSPTRFLSNTHTLSHPHTHTHPHTPTHPHTHTHTSDPQALYLLDGVKVFNKACHCAPQQQQVVLCVVCCSARPTRAPAQKGN